MQFIKNSKNRICKEFKRRQESFKIVGNGTERSFTLSYTLVGQFRFIIREQRC